MANDAMTREFDVELEAFDQSLFHDIVIDKYLHITMTDGSQEDHIADAVLIFSDGSLKVFRAGDQIEEYMEPEFETWQWGRSAEHMN